MKRKELYKELGLNEKRIPFSTPEGYFDDFSNALFTKIDAIEEKSIPKKKTILLQPWVRKVASIAAVLLIVFIPTRIILNNVLNANLEQNMSELDYIQYMNETQIYDLMTSENETNTGLDQNTLEEAVFASVTDYELYSMR